HRAALGRSGRPRRRARPHRPVRPGTHRHHRGRSGAAWTHRTDAPAPGRVRAHRRGARGGAPVTTARFLIGDVFEVMATLPDQSVDLVLTSPPFLALRSYLPDDHPDKAKEIGSEPDPATFLDTLLRLTAEWGRLLTPHGSIAVELGDTYAGSGGAGGDYNEGGLREGQGKFDGAARRGRVVDHDSGRRNPGPGWPLDKSLCFIPQLYGAS